MGFDGKYGRVTTEHGDIPDHEPVMVFRARDLRLPDVLDFYARQCEYNASPAEHVELVRQARDRIIQWQTDHPEELRIPTSGSYFQRLEDERRG